MTEEVSAGERQDLFRAFEYLSDDNVEDTFEAGCGAKRRQRNGLGGYVWNREKGAEVLGSDGGSGERTRK